MYSPLYPLFTYISADCTEPSITLFSDINADGRAIYTSCLVILCTPYGGAIYSSCLLILLPTVEPSIPLV